MREMKKDSFYKILSEKYDELLLDYVLLSCDEEYHGEESHKKAVKRNEDIRPNSNKKMSHDCYSITEQQPWHFL